MHTLIISTRTTTEHGTFIRLSERNALLQKLRPNILRRNEVRGRGRGRGERGCGGGCRKGRRGEGRDGGERGEVAQLVLRVCDEIISGGLERYELLGIWVRILKGRGRT